MRDGMDIELGSHIRLRQKDESAAGSTNLNMNDGDSEPEKNSQEIAMNELKLANINQKAEEMMKDGNMYEDYLIQTSASAAIQ